MEILTQFSVFMANKPGVLAQICRAMAKEKINITAMSMADTAENGVLRLTADAADSARAVLGRLNVPLTETEVLSVPVPNRIGAVADLCDRLSSSHVHISYMYGTTGGVGARTTVIFKVNDAGSGFCWATASATTTGAQMTISPSRSMATPAGAANGKDSTLVAPALWR